MILKYSKAVGVFTFTIDLLLLNLSLAYANAASNHLLHNGHRSADLLIIINLSWLTVTSFSKYYELPTPLLLSKSYFNFSQALMCHLLLSCGLIFFLKNGGITGCETIFTYTLYLLFVTTQRIVMFQIFNTLTKKGHSKRHALVVGETQIATKSMSKLLMGIESGYPKVDFISYDNDQNSGNQRLFDEISVIGPDEIFVCSNILSTSLLQQLVNFGNQNSIAVNLIPHILLKTNYSSISRYDDLTIIQLSSQNELNFHTAFLKRAFDISFALCAILFGSPLLLILVIITKLTSRGPVFFSQQRVGQNQKPFKLYKLRSMFVGAEPAGPQLSSANDSRITTWGKIIRRSRLDELPQFWNVLKGDMSVVGPRPERQFFMEQILAKSPGYLRLLKLKPGLTSIGQINFGYAENVDQMCQRARYDLIYLDKMTFALDVELIFKTIKIMSQMKGK